MTDTYLYLIMALLPLAAGLVVLQDDPYHALVMRGILGAIAAMIYAVFGAADVALTEALVGTMLAITLYAIAVRSSLVMRLGVLEEADQAGDAMLGEWVTELRSVLKKRYLRLELVPFANPKSLERAFCDRDIHGMYEGRSLLHQSVKQHSDSQHPDSPSPDHLKVRVPRLYEILKAEFSTPTIELSYVHVAEGESLPLPADHKTPDFEEMHL
jgi:putative multicomponent Na+:H+ antiporter subunit B